MDFIKPFIVFLIINFTALGLGSWLMADGSSSTWYMNLNKAPWTPPGWVFGAAWTTIMICFSAYLAFLYKELDILTPLYILFSVQFLLNVSWNYFFFNKHLTEIALVDIISLLVIIGIFLFKFNGTMGIKSLLILPYFLWLIIASSLNLYIVLKN